MRKTVSVLLAALLACMPLAACGDSGTGQETAEPFVPKSLRYVAAPENAFPEEGGRVIAVGENGGKLLICSRFNLYLWDVAAAKRIPVYFTDRKDIEYFNLIMLSPPVGEKASADFTAKWNQTISDYLASKGIEYITDFDQVREASGGYLGKPLNTYVASAEEDYALVQLVNYNLVFAVNLSTGEARLVDYPYDYALVDPESIPWLTKYGMFAEPSMLGSRVFSRAGITDLLTGETLTPELTPPEEAPSEKVSTISSALPLPDGHFLAAMRGMRNYDPKKEPRPTAGSWYLFDFGAGSSSWINLGEHDVRSAPNRMHMTGDGKYVAVYDPAWAGLEPDITVVSRETGEIRHIADPDRSLYIAGVYDTGFVCFDWKASCFLRVDAETLSEEIMAVTGENCPEITTLLGSGMICQGRYYCAAREFIDGYFVAEE